jgi:hypothetical protein
MHPERQCRAAFIASKSVGLCPTRPPQVGHSPTYGLSTAAAHDEGDWVSGLHPYSFLPIISCGNGSRRD